MKHKAVIVSDTKIEKCGFTRNFKIKAVLLTCGNKTVTKLSTLFPKHLRRIEPLHLRNTSKTSGKRLCAHPIRACINNGRGCILHMFLTANSRHIVTVCKSFTKADKVCLKAVIMVGTCKVKTESRTNIVDDKNHTVIVTELTNLCPLLFGSGFIIKEVTVVIRLCDKTCKVAVSFVICLLHSVHIKPRNYNIIFNFLRKNARVVSLLCPLEVAVIIALKEHHLLFARMCSCTHNGECCCVRAVLHKESPVSHSNSILEKFGTLYHLI